MRQIFIPLLLIATLISCDSDEPIFIDEAINQEIRTDPNIAFFHVSKEESRATFMDVHHPLGHGYDVTGEYMSEGSGRKRIFDLEKVAQEFDSRVSIMPIHIQQGGSADHENAREFSHRFFADHKDLRGKAFFKNTLETFFPEQDHSKDFLYSDFSIDMLSKSHRFFDIPLEKYYTEEFIKAINNNTPEEIVKEYGTHYLANIIVGASVQIIYRTETDNEDRLRSSNYGLQVARHNIFKPLDAVVNKFIAEGNFNQQLSFRVKGGDQSKLQIAEVDGMKRIDFTAWQASINEGNQEMVKMIIYPIHNLVLNETKQKELEDYIEKYIEDNQIEF